MGAVWIRAGAELRAHVARWIVTALLLGIAGGVVITAAVGARRTDSVFDRLVESTKAHDLIVQPNEDPDAELIAKILALPQVEAAGQIAMVPADLAAGTHEPFSWSITTGAPVDDSIGTELDRFRITQGRKMDYDDPQEAMVNASFLRSSGVEVGDRLTLRTVTFEELFRYFDGEFPIPTGPEVTIRLVGVAQLPDDVGFSEEQGLIYLTPAFYEKYVGQIATLDAMFVKLGGGLDDIESYLADVRSVAGGDQVFGFETRAELSAQVDKALSVQATALWIFAGIVALGAALVVGQQVNRMVFESRADDLVVRALGGSRGTRVLALLLPAIGAAVLGAIIAVGVAVVGSLRMPVGSARVLEPDPGLWIDRPVMVVGGVVLIVVVLIAAAVSAVRVVVAPRAGVERPSFLPNLLARSGASPAVVNGARFGLERGRGRTEAPVRSAMIGVAAGALAVGAVLTFDASFDRLLDTPTSYGWNWDLVLSGGEDPELAAQSTKELAASPLVSDVSLATVQQISARGHDVETLVIDQVEGAARPRVVRGSYPAGTGEVALGARTMDEEGVGIGDTISLSGSAQHCGGAEGCPVKFTVVGQVLFWSEEGEPGTGIVMTRDGRERLAHSDGFSDVLVGLAPGVTVDDFREEFDRPSASILEPRAPIDVQNLGRARGVARALAAVLGALAVVAITLGLVTSIHRRSRDLEVLRVIGFIPRQLRRTVAWQARFMVGTALLVGVPLGLLAGRWAWGVMAERLSVADVPAFPMAVVLAAVLGLFAMGHVIAVLATRWAGLGRVVLNRIDATG